MSGVNQLQISPPPIWGKKHHRGRIKISFSFRTTKILEKNSNFSERYSGEMGKPETRAQGTCWCQKRGRNCPDWCSKQSRSSPPWSSSGDRKAFMIQYLTYWRDLVEWSEEQVSNVRCPNVRTSGHQIEDAGVEDGENCEASLAQDRPVNVHKTGKCENEKSESGKRKSGMHETENCVRMKSELRHLRSNERRAPARVVAASTPPFRWQRHCSEINTLPLRWEGQ